MKKTKKEVSQRQLEGYERYGKLIQWGRRNPVMFCEYMMGIEFMDYQRYWALKFLWIVGIKCLLYGLWAEMVANQL